MLSEKKTGTGATSAAERASANVDGLDTNDTGPVSRGAELEIDALHLRSHARIAHLVAARNLGQLLHVAGIGWYCWDGRRFVRDLEDKRVTGRIVAKIRELAPMALSDKDLLADQRQAQTANGVAGVARIMSTLEGIRAEIHELDADPLLLNTVNGVLDLRELDSAAGVPADWRTLTLLPHDPKYRMTQITMAAYRPEADDARFRAFLDRSLPDVDVRGFLQRVLGAALLGVQLLHLLLVLEGVGRNGKGVFYGVAHCVLGGYSYVAPSSLFDLTKGDPNRPSPAFLELRGRRLVWVSETAKAAVMDSALIKRLTGGDPITGRLLHKNDAVTFDPSHQLMLITNDAPRLPADDPAVWARVRRVPWDVVIPAEDQDSALPEKLKAEADAVLSWMLAGLADFRANGLDEPRRVQEATEMYRADQDTIALFQEARCDGCDPNDGSSTRELHIAYRGFCRGNAVLPEHMLGERDFGARLDALGFPTIKGTGGRRFRSGLLLLPGDDEARVAAQSAEAVRRAISAKDASVSGVAHQEAEPRRMTDTSPATLDGVIDRARADGRLVEGGPALSPVAAPWEDVSDGGAS